MGTVMPVRNVLNDPGMFLPKGEFTGLMAFMMDARKNLPVDAWVSGGLGVRNESYVCSLPAAVKIYYLWNTAP